MLNAELTNENAIELEMAKLPTEKPSNRRRAVMMPVVAILALLAAYKGYGSYSFGQGHVETDNAYVTGDLVNISPTVSGTLAELKVADGDFVHKGQLIARLGTDSASAMLAQAEANLQAAESQIPQAQAELAFTKLSTDAAIQSSEAGVATQTARTRGSQMQVRLSTDTIHNQVLQAQAQVAQARAQASQAAAGVTEARAAIASAELAVKAARSNVGAAAAGEASAKAESTRTAGDLQRFRTLYKEEAISQQQLDNATAAAATAAANLEAAVQRSQAAAFEVERAKSAVTQSQSRLTAAIGQADAAEKQVEVAKSGLALARSNSTQVGIQDANVQTNQGQGGQASAALSSAKAGLQQVSLREKQVATARAQLLQAQAAVADAKIHVRDAYLYAPCDGYVVKHTANVGTSINPGQTIVTITHGTDVWVTANFKETQLDKVRQGQRVDIEVDAYPGKTFHGKVLSIMQATGSATTLLPPDNSTGNFTKIVQRVPVKIAVDSRGSELRQGMSVDATIDTSSRAKE